MGDNQVSNSLRVGNAFNALGPVHAGSGGERQVTDADQLGQYPLVNINRSYVADEKLTIALLEQTAFEGHTVRIDTHQGLAAFEPRDEPGDQQPGKN